MFRAAIMGAAGALLAVAPAVALERLSPNDIQTTFFNGQPFTSSTASNTKFTMVFTTDGKVTRAPQGKAGVKGEGTWKLSNDGFCTTWKKSKENCYGLAKSGDNKWSVLKGTSAVAYWAK